MLNCLHSRRYYFKIDESSSYAHNSCADPSKRLSFLKTQSVNETSGEKMAKFILVMPNEANAQQHEELSQTQAYLISLIILNQA